MFIRIPLSPETPSSRLRCTLDGVDYAMRVDYNGGEDRWYLDLLTVDGIPIVLGLKLLPGQDMLDRLVSDLRPAGSLLLIAPDAAGYQDIGRIAHLVYTSDPTAAPPAIVFIPEPV